jgi:hypothetical protein
LNRWLIGYLQANALESVLFFPSLQIDYELYQAPRDEEAAAKEREAAESVDIRSSSCRLDRTITPWSMSVLREQDHGAGLA